MGVDETERLLEIKRMAKEIKEQHERSGAVFNDRKKSDSADSQLPEDALVELARERFSSIYEVDFYPKKVTPLEPRPASVTRRNNPHPSQVGG